MTEPARRAEGPDAAHRPPGAPPGERSWPARVATGASIGALLARECARLGYDRATRRTGIPATVDDLDAAYLSSITGHRVERFDVLEGTEGTTDRVRLSLQGDDRLPETVFVKMASAGALIRLFGNIADLGGDEIRFYRDLRPNLDLEAPTVLGLDHDPRTRRFVLVLEDLQARDCEFGDVLEPFDPARAEAALETLAKLHGSYWRHPGLEPDRRSAGGLAWVRANGSDPMLPAVAALVRRLARRVGRTRPELVGRTGEGIVRSYGSLARKMDAGHHTILHGDPHPGNWYFDGDRAGLLDWQAVRKGDPLRDVAYLLVLALDPADRRTAERDLLDRYRVALADRGGPALGIDEAWNRYRSMAAYPYVAAMFTAGFGGLQADDTAFEGLRRAASAVDELDPLAAFASW